MARYASIDIGSNSIRMLAAEALDGGGIRELAAERQVVRLGTSVFRDGRLSNDAMNLACQSLERMSAVYRQLDVLAIRAVGTAALRDALNREEFLARASGILGAPVEIISGLEEARLIHLGVQLRWPHPKQKVLIADIGGGSAELVLSEKGHLMESYSKSLGAVRMSELFLKSDPPDPRELVRLQRYIQERLAGPAAKFSRAKIDRMIATSATAAAAVCAANNIRRSQRDEADKMRASQSQIRRLLTELSTLSVAQRAKHTGIGPRRAEIIVAGVAVLLEIMQLCGAASLYYSNAGVRDGIIADLIHHRAGGSMDEDQRHAVQALAHRYGINARHAAKVASLATQLFEGLTPLHRLPLECGRVLEAGAYLYNIGHFVNESKHHRHSLYLVYNSDLPGFTDRERLMVANLCRYHRKSMPQPTHEMFQTLPSEDRRAVVLLAPLLRLAVALDQSQQQRVGRVECVTNNGQAELRLFANADLDIEQWQANSIAPVFEEVYGLPLSIKVKR